MNKSFSLLWRGTPSPLDFLFYTTMIDTHCDRCGCAFKPYGALLISPTHVTDRGTTDMKHHICPHCYETVFLPLLTADPLLTTFPPTINGSATLPADPRMGKLTNEGADLLKDFAQSIGAMDSMPAWMRDEIEKKSTKPS